MAGPFPSVRGWGILGTVAAVGEGADVFAVGDSVSDSSSYQCRVLLTFGSTTPESQAMSAPEFMTKYLGRRIA